MSLIYQDIFLHMVLFGNIGASVNNVLMILVPSKFHSHALWFPTITSSVSHSICFHNVSGIFTA
nr:MAG TPA: hypothetical protein [Caudoviricetes sp.]